MLTRPLNRSACLALAFAALGAEVVTAQQTAEESPWSFFGGARLRAEFNDTDNGGADRHRMRVRVRMGARLELDDGLALVARISTGNPADPRTPYHDLGQGFDSMEWNLDQGYVAYAPERWRGAELVVGKYTNPVTRTPFFGELSWDADLDPEGIALTIPYQDLGPFEQGRFALAHTEIIEQPAAGDAFATMLQWDGRVAQGEERSWTYGLHYSLYGDLTPDGMTTFLGRGNAVVGGDYASDFGILHGTAVYQTGPWLWTGEALWNTRAADGVGDRGFALGAGVDTSWGRFYLQHQEVGEDAAVAFTAQDDFLYSTNFVSQVVGWRRSLGDGVSCHVWLQGGEREDAFGADDERVYRLRLDLDINF